ALPRVYDALLKALADPESSLATVVKLIEQDAGICAKVLQLVNSAFFGLPRQVTAVSQAVNLVGIAMLKNVMLSVEVFQALQADRAIPGFSAEDLQAHALLAASIARRIVRDQRLADDAFMAAMLHDVGLLVLASRLPDRLAPTLAAAAAQPPPVIQVRLPARRRPPAPVRAHPLR